MVHATGSVHPAGYNLASLQVARAVAATSVVVYHCSQATELRTGVKLTRFTDFGAAGVDVFFVISGLIMTLTMLRAVPFSTGDFLVRRAIRVVTLVIPLLAPVSLGLVRHGGLGVGWALVPLVGGSLVVGWLAYLAIEQPTTRWLQTAWHERRVLSQSRTQPRLSEGRAA